MAREYSVCHFDEFVLTLSGEHQAKSEETARTVTGGAAGALSADAIVGL